MSQNPAVVIFHLPSLSTALPPKCSSAGVPLTLRVNTTSAGLLSGLMVISSTVTVVIAATAAFFVKFSSKIAFSLSASASWASFVALSLSLPLKNVWYIFVISALAAASAIAGAVVVDAADDDDDDPLELLDFLSLPHAASSVSASAAVMTPS